MKFNSEQIKIIEYLKDQIAKKGQKFCFTKSKYIARDLGLSSRVVGTNMKFIAEKCEELKIKKHSKALATTWKVDLVV